MYTTSGDKIYTTTNAAGCDSVATLHLTINQSSSSSTTVTACDQYLWNGVLYTTSGDKTYTTTNAASCDSVATLHLTINQSSSSSTTITACDQYLWNGVLYTTSGDKTYTTTNLAGCDSVATLHLTINHSSTSSTIVTACDHYLWNGVDYTTSGDKIYTNTNAAGCDSVATLHLTINHSSTSSTTVTACDHYLWNGVDYTTSGDKTYTTINAAGCDSIATLHLTINHSSTSSTTVSACDHYLWNGVVYTTSGDKIYTTTNAAGCDSVATLHLSINPLPVLSITTSDVANNFCNGISLTTNSTTPVNTYSWSNAATMQSVFLTTADPAGNYTVNVIDENGCSATSAAMYTYNPEALTSSYTLLGKQSVKLLQNNTVVNGSVGIVNAAGSAIIKKNVSINGPGAFLKAQNISLQAPYTIPTIVYAPATVTLPTMQNNTTSTSGLSNTTVPNGSTTTLTGNFKNVTIGINCNVTLTGSIFGNITIGSGSIVLFTQSSIDVTAITLNAGTVSASTQLRFSGDATVRCAGSILVNTRCMVNPDNRKLVMYLGKVNMAPVSFTVAAGGNETINASMYIPSGKVSVGGDATNMTNMNGKFIAENIETLDKNVIWNWYDCSSYVAARPTAVNHNYNKPAEIKAEAEVVGLQVKAMPNPSNNYFNLEIESDNTEQKISLRVLDLHGRLVETLNNLTANQTLQIGNNYSPGVYMAEILQGNRKRVVKLVKL
jgi:hypothetical protein